MSRLKPYRIGPPYGGVEKSLAEHIIPDNTATVSDNFTLRSNGMQTVNGWEKFTSQVLTDGADTPANLSVYLIDEFYLSDGTIYLLAFTNKRVYRFDEVADLWIPITQEHVVDTITNPGASGELNLLSNLANTHAAAVTVRRTYGCAIVDSDSASGQKVLSVSHTGQFTAGEAVIIGMGTSRVEYGVIDSISAGVSITLVDNLSNAHTQAQGDIVKRVAELCFANDATGFDTSNNNDVYYFTDGVNSVQTWDGTGEHSALSGLESGDDVEGLGTLTTSLKAKYIRTFEGFIVLGHLTEEGTTIPGKIRWSQINETTKWVNETDGTGQAGSFLFSGPDFVMGLHQLKRELMIYRERSIEAMSYIGLPSIFGFRRAQTGTGLVSPFAVSDFGDNHRFLGPDNVWQYNGISLVELGDPIKDEFFDLCAPSQLSNTWMFFLEETDELWLCYSTTGDRVQNKAYIYNIRFGKWAGPREIDATGFGYYREQSSSTWDTLSGDWDTGPSTSWDSRAFVSNAPINLMGNDDGLIFKLDTVGTADGATISKRYESKRLDLGNAHLIKSVQRLRVSGNVAGDADLNIYLGTALSSHDTITWNGPYAMTLTNGYTPYVYMDLPGRFFKVRIDTDDSTTLDDIEVHYYERSEI